MEKIYQLQTRRTNTNLIEVADLVLINPPSEQGGGGGGAVDSVNGQTGVVVLDATDVGAEPALTFTPEDVANKATNLTSPDNTKYPTTQAVVTALDGVLKQITGSAGAVISVPITTETIVYTLPIPANTLGYNDFNNIQFPFRKFTGNNLNIRMYASDNIATLGNQFAFYGNSNTQQQKLIFERYFYIEETNELNPVLQLGGTSISNINALGIGVPTKVAFDPTIDNWIHITILFSAVAGDVQVEKAILNYF